MVREIGVHYYPINTDKYTILTHKRFQLGAVVDNGTLYNSDTGPANWRSGKVWIPINRQLRFETELASSCTTPIYVVYWADTFLH